MIKVRMFRTIPLFFLFPIVVLSQTEIGFAPQNQFYRRNINSILNFNVIKSEKTYYSSPLKIYYGERLINKKSITYFPRIYDLRKENYLTEVKDQGEVGSCWSFGIIGAIESNLLQREKLLYDLSEENMATCHGFYYKKNDGGNFEIATSYLVTHKGPLLENEDPYIDDTNSVCKVYNVNPVFYIDDVRWISINNIGEDIKQQIIDYGAVTVSMYLDESIEYYNWGDNTYYYNGNEYPNHMVLLVGWDDNKKITGGTTNFKTRFGGWIAKNSYGTDWGNEGFFYVSYEDTRFGETGTFFPEIKQIIDYDTIYYYDELGPVSSIGFFGSSEGEENKAIGHGYGIVKFSPDKPQLITKIGTYIVSAETFIDIEINDDFRRGNIAKLENQYCEYPGYYTFDINAVVEDDFYVKIKYSSTTSEYPIPIEIEEEEYAYPHIENDKFWVSSNGNDWQNLGENIEDSQFDLCIKAYARKDKPILKELKNEEAVKIYPVPTTGFINIALNYLTDDEININLYDISGKQLENLSLSPDEINSDYLWNLSNYSSGLYLIQIEDGQMVELHKIQLIK
ncbi:MAG: T9SS type A sorting domain-containing protein [Bacteroidales bacterium]|nr:T9SS type A sorting domain-containing protein [Bacteroidales bacterium]